MFYVGEDTSNKSECNNSEAERLLKGMWIIEEVIKALEMGYEIIEILEVWRMWSNAIYLLVIYSLLLRIKSSKSNKRPLTGLRIRVKKARYIEEFSTREDVVENPGLPSLAKLCLIHFGVSLVRQKINPGPKLSMNPVSCLTCFPVHI